MKIGDKVLCRRSTGTPWEGTIVDEFPSALMSYPILYKIRIVDESVSDKPFYLLRDEDDLDVEFASDKIIEL